MPLSFHRRDLLAQPQFDDYLHTIANLSPQWAAQEIEGSVLGAWNTAVDTGRELLNEDGASGTATAANWTAAASTLSNPVVGDLKILANAGAGLQQPGANQFLTTEIGKTYRFTGITDSDGATIPRVNSGVQVFAGDVSTDQDVDIEFIAGATHLTLNTVITDPAGTEFVIWRNMTLQQTGILASSAYGTPGDNPLDGSDTATTVGVATGLQSMPYARRFDGATSFIALPSDYNSILDPATFSAFIFAKPSWDATERDFFSHTIDADNYIRVGQSATAGTARWEIKSDGDLSSRTFATGAPDKFSFFGISSEGGVMQAIFNGVQVGADITLVGTVIGNFVTMIIGARNGTPTHVLDGDAMNYDSATRALTAGEWSDIYQRSGI